MSKKTIRKEEKPKYPIAVGAYTPPAFASGSDTDSYGGSVQRTSRGGTTSTNTIENKYPYIKELLDPFNYNGDYVDIKEVLTFTEKMYFGFPLFRNVVEILTELANQDVYLEGSNKAARTFIDKWLKKVGIWSLKDKWFRTCVLYANVYPYRFDASLNSESFQKIGTIFGKMETTEAAVKLPIKYIFLNPASMTREVGLTESGDFVKALSIKEIQRIKNPKTEEDREFRNQFSSKELSEIDNSSSGYMLKLKPDRLYYTGWKILDHFPFAVPFSFGLFKDVNFKLLLKRMDEELAKNTDLIILLLTSGNEPDKGGINYANVKALQELFKNPQVQRVLCADYTTKGQWLVPDISSLLSKEKYEQVDLDLKRGMFSAIFDEGEKFASLSIKVKVFLEKLVELRNLFLNDFLQPEIKRVCKSMGFKTYPTAKFIDFDLEDNMTLRKIYLRMVELGILSPNEIKDAIERGILPDEETMIENQKKYKDWKEDDLFQPQLNRKEEEAGRPVGTTAPKTKTTTRPIGTKAQLSLDSIRKTVLDFDKVETKISELLSKQIKNIKDEDFAGTVFNISQAAVLNNIEDLKSFIKNPIKSSAEDLSKIKEIEEEFGISERSATIVYLTNRSK